MIEPIAYHFLKSFEEYNFLSIADFRLITKNKISLENVSSQFHYSYNNGFLTYSKLEGDITHGFPLNLKFKLTTEGQNAISEYEHNQSQKNFSNKIAIISLVVASLSFLMSLATLFK